VLVDVGVGVGVGVSTSVAAKEWILPHDNPHEAERVVGLSRETISPWMIAHPRDDHPRQQG
jgi:hypothetical protein